MRNLTRLFAGLYSFGPRLMEGRDTPARPRLTPGEFLSLYTAAGFVGEWPLEWEHVCAHAQRPSCRWNVIL